MRYRKTWSVSLNTSGRNAPMKLRSDFSETLTKMHRLHREFGKRDLHRFFSTSIRNSIRLLHPVHHVEIREDSSTVLILQEQLCIFRALQGHSGRNLIDLSLQDNVII